MGKVALVTGASRGLGATVAEFLAGAGYDLILTARREAYLASAAALLDRYGTTVRWLAGDVADPWHRDRLVRIAEELGRLDLLFNNASDLGTTPLPSLAKYPLDRLERVFAVNVVAPVALIQEALPLLRANEGLVVNITSDAAIGGTRDGAATARARRRWTLRRSLSPTSSGPKESPSLPTCTRPPTPARTSPIGRSPTLLSPSGRGFSASRTGASTGAGSWRRPRPGRWRRDQRAPH